LWLGNLNAKRDWGHAEDYVEAMWRILTHDSPDDFVIASGETRSVREFAESAFGCAGIGIEWRGEGLDEKGVDSKTGRVLIEVDPRYFRPTEVDLLLGDPSKAERLLGWKRKVSFGELVRRMVDYDMRLVDKNQSMLDAGFDVASSLEEG
ncbi:MAG: GDP-mannose 4,6-dehydratase, partial [Synergistaceae bacterium]|nr:GDP-mannose 4,6-dehydratase [Synergistaceae bacterium]